MREKNYAYQDERGRKMTINELSELVELHGREIYGFCYKLAQNKADADDLYQETFLKATEFCQKIDSTKNPKGFLITITLGIYRNNRRKFAWRQRIAPSREWTDDWDEEIILNSRELPEDIVVKNEEKRLIQEAANSLNEKLRIPLYLYYTAEFSVEQIAGILKIPVGTVKSRLFKARKVLKKIMEDSEYEKIG